MTAANMDRVIRLVFGHEGGYANHPNDPGGPTKFGITAKTLGSFRRLGRQATAQEVMALTLPEARAILVAQYAKPIQFDRLPEGLDYAAFDFAVNSGPAQAVKTLQRILGLNEDGFMGETSIATVVAICKRGDLEDLIVRYCDARLAFMKRLRSWSSFSFGWSRRVAQVKAGALAMIPGGTHPVMLVDAAQDVAEADAADAEGSSAGPYPELDDNFLPGPEDAGIGDAKAEASETKVTATRRGKAAVVTAAGAAGNAGTEAIAQVGSISQSMADQIAPYTSYLKIVGYVFAALTIIGVAATLYLAVRNIAQGNPQ